MTYQLTDITELIHYHLVLSASDDETADNNLRRLVHEIENLATTPLWRPAEWDASLVCQAAETSHSSKPFVEYGWIPCDSCGAWVGTELLGPDGAGYTADGAFNCSSCRWGDEDDD